jgi:hypothetical protein
VLKKVDDKNIRVKFLNYSIPIYLMNDKLLMVNIARGLWYAVRTMRGQLVVFTPRRLLSFAGTDNVYTGKKVVKYLELLVEAGYIHVFDAKNRKNSQNPNKPKVIHRYAIDKHDKAFEMAMSMDERTFINEIVKILAQLVEEKEKERENRKNNKRHKPANQLVAEALIVQNVP